MKEFNNRKQEISIYISFLEGIEKDNSILTNALGNSDTTKELRKILYANTYLLMYNLVESSIRNSIQGIYDHFKQQKISFDSLRIKLQEIILTNMRSQNLSEFLTNIHILATDIVYLSFDSQKIASGNVDARKIREIAEIYGFSHKTNYHKCKEGKQLLVVKNKRNDLAHGIISFSECGKDTSLSDVKQAFDELSAFLTEIILNIDKYIQNKDYLK